MFILLTVVAGILNLALWLPAKSNAPIIVFAALYGVASGGVFSMLPAIVAQISDVRQLGVRNGSIYAFISFAILTGPSIGGALISHDHGGYSGLQIFAGVTLLAGVCFISFARISQVGFTMKVKV